ncbi:sensor histidine kinase [Bacillus thuringiensis]|uniref:sensor histidine kinase n=1 Tax=Bacillus thuringiensis TaxID=1428 RepID=UPI00156F5D99|nr:sensor histidine kinase [Bacillus thuringiensis]
MFKVVISTAILWIYYSNFANQEQVVIVICIFYIAIYFFMIWSPKNWWNVSKYTFICILLIGTTIMLRFLGIGFGLDLLLWPLVCLLASAPKKFIQMTSLQAICTIIVVLELSWTSTFPYSTLLALGGVYVGIRGRSLLREAYQINQEQLIKLEKMHEELKNAHIELQKATLQSMRYAALTERTRIAREIHDGLGHQMTSLIVQLQALEFMLPNDPQTAAKTVNQLLEIARTGMNEVRMTVREWASDEKGLGIIALRGFISQAAANSKIQFHFKEEGDFSEWDEEISIAIFRILQESITNVIRHSGASEVDMYIKEKRNEISLIVSDNGRFIDKGSFKNGFGVKGMIERCHSVGGNCTFSTNPQGGLVVKVIIPLANL